MLFWVSIFCDWTLYLPYIGPIFHSTSPIPSPIFWCNLAGRPVTYLYGKLLWYLLNKVHTHVSLVLESEVAALAAAVEVRGALAVEWAGLGAAVFGGAEPLEALLNDGRVLAVVVRVHLRVGGGDVYLVTARLQKGNDRGQTGRILEITYFQIILYTSLLFSIQLYTSISVAIWNLVKFWVSNDVIHKILGDLYDATSMSPWSDEAECCLGPTFFVILCSFNGFAKKWATTNCYNMPHFDGLTRLS